MAQLHAPGYSTNPRIAADAGWIEHHYKVRVTAGQEATGHAAGGDHPVGLALDVVPDFARGGTWDDVDALAGFAAKHPSVFRFVGYDGRLGTTAWPNHGRGDHLHLSWHGGPSDVGATTRTITGSAKDGSLIDVIGNALDFSKPPGPTSVQDSYGKGVPGVEAIVGAIFGALVDAIGRDGARVLLSAALVLGALVLIVVGTARAAGVKPSTVASVVPAGRALRAVA